jgi:hypothetical protein
MRNNNEKDSIENTISNYYEAQSMAKDSLLVIQQRQYSLLKSSFDQSIKQQQAFVMQLRFL